MRVASLRDRMGGGEVDGRALVVEMYLLGKFL
jgi:hypothetical protein